MPNHLPGTVLEISHTICDMTREEGGECKPQDVASAAFIAENFTGNLSTLLEMIRLKKWMANPRVVIAAEVIVEEAKKLMLTRTK